VKPNGSSLGEAMVLAAGKGERIASVTGGIPKPLLAIKGEPIIARNIRWLASAGIRHIWVNLHHRGDLIKAALGDGAAFGVVDIHYSEESELLGTAGAVRKVLADLASTALVVYGDNLLDFDLDGFRRAHSERGADVTIAVFDEHSPNTGIAGGRVGLDKEFRVTHFTEGEPRSAVSSFVNAGVYAVRTAILESFPIDTFLDWGRDVFPRLIAAGARLFGHAINGYCLGLDTPNSYERGMAMIESGAVTLR
jgi:NDP-sugar pyrophosphorylase family protein